MSISPFESDEEGESPVFSRAARVVHPPLCEGSPADHVIPGTLELAGQPIGRTPVPDSQAQEESEVLALLAETTHELADAARALRGAGRPGAAQRCDRTAERLRLQMVRLVRAH